MQIQRRDVCDAMYSITPKSQNPKPKTQNPKKWIVMK
jgi:hypothetical protein